VLGRPLARPAGYLHRVGALIESPAFYPARSGRDNLRILATIARIDPARIPAVLELVGLTDRAGDRYRSYSLGMKQRLGIAAALLGDPELLILDEPANGLDPEGVRDMRSLVARLGHSERTVLVSSHDLSELEQVCDWLVLIDRGRSLYQGPASGLQGGTALSLRTRRPEEAACLHRVLAANGVAVGTLDPALAGPDATALEVAIPDDGTHPAGVADLAARVNQLAFDAGVVLVELAPRRRSLEDRYLDLVQKDPVQSDLVKSDPVQSDLVKENHR
jgi:ABC-2 type transport system ATP-binding protein